MPHLLCWLLRGYSPARGSSLSVCHTHTHTDTHRHTQTCLCRVRFHCGRPAWPQVAQGTAPVVPSGSAEACLGPGGGRLPAAPRVLEKNACPAAAPAALYLWPRDYTVTLPCPCPAVCFSVIRWSVRGGGGAGLARLCAACPRFPSTLAWSAPRLCWGTGQLRVGRASRDGRPVRCPDHLSLSHPDLQPYLGVNTAMPAFSSSLLAAVSFSTC